MAAKPCRLAFGAFQLDAANAELWRGDQRIALPPKPFDLLCHLVEHPGRLLTKDELLESVWKNLHVSESNLTFTMNAVRAALGDDAQAPRYIETVKRRGYRFIAPVSAASAPAPDRALRMANLPSTVATGGAGWRVGRTGPLDVFDEAFRQCLAGRRQIVFVTGEAGIGKTTFVEMAMSRVPPREVVVLRGCCVELFGTNEAFLPLIEALQELCQGAESTALRDMLREHAPTWLAQMPAFVETKDRAEFQHDIFGATRERMLREFCDLLEVLADALPLIVILEDLHWSDLGTLDLLSRLARRDRKAAILVLATFRSNMAAARRPSIRTVSHELQMRRCASEIALEPLSLEEVEDYMTRRFASSDIAHRLAEPAFRRTQGQPLFMVSLVDHFVSRKAMAPCKGEDRPDRDEAISFEGIIPRDLRDMITIQIEHLSEDERHLVEQASAAGAEFSAAMLTGVLERNAFEVEQACESLARRGHILVSTGSSEWPDGTVSGRYAFRHALYQEVLYQRLAPGRRVKVHRLLAELLERGYQTHLADIVSVLALHFEEGRNAEKAIFYLDLSAANAVKRFSNREAESYLTRALALVDRLPTADQAKAQTKILRGRGRIRRVIGDFSGCMADLSAAVASAEAAGNLRSEVTALMDLSRFCHYADRPRCLQVAQHAVARSEALDDAFLKAIVRSNHANHHIILKGWNREYADICYETIGLVRDAEEPPVAMRRCQIESTIKFLTSDYAEACAAAHRGSELARITGDGYIFVLFNTVEAFARLHMGSWGEMQRGLAAASATAERNASRQARFLCHLMGGWLRAEALDFQGARDCCDRAFEERAEFNYFIGQILLLKACVGLGDHAKARASLDEITRKVDVDGIDMESYFRPHFHHSACELWLALGDLDAARVQAERLHAWTKQAPERTFLSLAHRLLGRIALVRGELEAAADQLSEATAVLAGNDLHLPLAAWRVYATAASIQSRLGRAKEAENLATRSRSVIDALAATLAPGDPLRGSLRMAYAIEA